MVLSTVSSSHVQILNLDITEENACSISKEVWEWREKLFLENGIFFDGREWEEQVKRKKKLLFYFYFLFHFIHLFFSKKTEELEKCEPLFEEMAQKIENLSSFASSGGGGGGGGGWWVGGGGRGEEGGEGGSEFSTLEELLTILPESINAPVNKFTRLLLKI